MSNNAVDTSKSATITVDDGVATVTIYLQPISNYILTDGWVTALDIPGASNTTFTASGGYEAGITNSWGWGTYLSNFYFYETAVVTFDMSDLTVDSNGSILISDVQPSTELVLTGTQTHSVLPDSMTNAMFDIELTPIS